MISTKEYIAQLNNSEPKEVANISLDKTMQASPSSPHNQALINTTPLHLHNSPNPFSYTSTPHPHYVLNNTLPLGIHPLNDSKSLTSDQKLDFIIDKVTSIESSQTKLSSDVTTLQTAINTIDTLKLENIALKEQLYSTQGRVTRLEDRDLKMREKIEQLEYRGMSKSIIIFNLAEYTHQVEQSRHTIAKVYKLLKDDLEIPEEYLFGQKNPCGDIRIDTAYRVGGQAAANSIRRTIVHFTTQSGRDLVISGDFMKNLRKNKKFVRISEFFPGELRERRSIQVDSLKSLKEHYKETGQRVKVNIVQGDKLAIDKVIQQDSPFEMNPLPRMAAISMNMRDMVHSEPIIEKDSRFVGHAVEVKSYDEAVAAKNAIFQIPELARATHILYAYKFTDEYGHCRKGFSDDSEVGGGRILRDEIESSEINNIFLAVTREKKGGNIGNPRFDHIRDVSKAVIEILKENPVRENIFHNLQYD